MHPLDNLAMSLFHRQQHVKTSILPHTFQNWATSQLNRVKVFGQAIRSSNRTLQTHTMHHRRTLIDTEYLSHISRSSDDSRFINVCLNRRQTLLLQIKIETSRNPRYARARLIDKHASATLRDQ